MYRSKMHDVSSQKQLHKHNVKDGQFISVLKHSNIYSFLNLRDQYVWNTPSVHYYIDVIPFMTTFCHTIFLFVKPSF